jgi:hypothetical protein
VWLKLPLLFDLFTVALLTAGCLLLWLSLRMRSESLLPAVKKTGDLAENVDVKIGGRPEELELKEGSELQADSAIALLNAAPPPELNAPAEFSIEQNKYARRVAAAIAKSRKPHASV